jgi:hypothetical protein
MGIMIYNEQKKAVMFSDFLATCWVSRHSIAKTSQGLLEGMENVKISSREEG